MGINWSILNSAAHDDSLLIDWWSIGVLGFPIPDIHRYGGVRVGHLASKGGLFADIGHRVRRHLKSAALSYFNYYPLYHVIMSLSWMMIAGNAKTHLVLFDICLSKSTFTAIRLVDVGRYVKDPLNVHRRVALTLIILC